MTIAMGTSNASAWGEADDAVVETQPTAWVPSAALCAAYITSLLVFVHLSEWAKATLVSPLIVFVAICCIPPTVQAFMSRHAQKKRLRDAAPKPQHIVVMAALAAMALVSSMACEASSNTALNKIAPVLHWTAVAVVAAVALWVLAAPAARCWDEFDEHLDPAGPIKVVVEAARSAAAAVWKTVLWVSTTVLDLHCRTAAVVLPTGFTFGGTPEPIQVREKDGTIGVVQPKNAPPKRFYGKVIARARAERIVRWFDAPLVRPHSKEHLERRGGKDATHLLVTSTVTIMVIYVAANVHF